MSNEQRFNVLQAWLADTLKLSTLNLIPLAGDASFRRYYRLRLSADQSYMVMDAPPGLEDVKPFIAIAQAFATLGVRTPQIFASNIEQGFLLLTDFGDRLYLSELNDDNVDELYSIALNALLKIQTCQPEFHAPLTVFDKDFMTRELQLFEEWFLARHLQVVIPQKILQGVYDVVITSAESQPQRCVHRDYHSRNLLILPDSEVGVLDFQDAVWGPVTYDVISLLKDSYIDWPRVRIIRWAENFWEQSITAGLLPRVSFEQYLRWFDLMALQRHLKVLFIFARKFHRDGSTHYLSDIPRTLNYVMDIAKDYTELGAFYTILEQEIAPGYNVELSQGE